VFSALAMAFGVAALALGVIGLVQALTAPRLDPKDFNRDREEYRD